MAVTYTATLLGTGGTLKSKVSNAGVSTAGLTSLELVTVVHRLPTTPQVYQVQTRSIIGTPSAGGPQYAWGVINASIVELYVSGAGVGVVQANIDVICEIYHSGEL